MKSKAQFDRVFSTGRKFSSNGVLLAAAANGLESNRYGLMVTTKAGKAVVRNRGRRWLREFFQANSARIRPGWDVVVRLGRPESVESYAETTARLQVLLVESRLMESGSVC